VADAETAVMLLRPFRIENLTDAHMNSFGRLASGYGPQWSAELLRTWFGGERPTWAYGEGWDGRSGWRISCPACSRGCTPRAVLAVAAQRLLDLAWELIGKDIRSGLGLSLPSHRDKKLSDLGKPLASVLMAAAIGADGPWVTTHRARTPTICLEGGDRYG